MARAAPIAATREAFEALAAQIERILNQADNVVQLRGGKA
jgi:hypothetical protein